MNQKEIQIKNNAIIHKNNSLNRLNLSFINHIELGEYKTSELLAYWIHDYVVYHNEEKNFDISKSGVFSRGDIIKVNLGFNIGNELGGLHYCVVLTKYDNTRNGTINVIPLTSKKENKKYDSSVINLGNALYNIFQERLKKEKQKLQQIFDEFGKIENVPINIQNMIEKENKYIEKMENEVSKMKQDSIALISQITTISKQRIFKDTISKNVRLSRESLNLIDKQIIKYFTKINIV